MISKNLTLSILITDWFNRLKKKHKWSIGRSTIISGKTNEPVVIHLLYEPYNEKIDVIDIDTIENKAFGPISGYDIHNKWIDQEIISITDPQFFKKLRSMMRSVEKEFRICKDVIRRRDGHQTYYSIHRGEWRDECL
jgi:hypothetical protein